MRTRVVTALVAAAALGLTACASSSIPTLPAAPTTVAGIPTTTVPEGSEAYLEPVAGVTTSTTTNFGPGGTSAFKGVVDGPNGAIAGAVVEVERITSTSSPPAVDDVTTAADGTWTLSGILGGAYQLRAWKAPTLALTTPVGVFLAAGETRQIQLQVQQYNGVVVTSSMAPDPPLIGQPDNLVVQVANTTVDSNGVVRSVPLAAATVELSGSDEWQVATADPATTGNNGQVEFQLVCQSSGSQPLEVTVDGGSPQALDQIDPCEPPPTTTTTSTTSPTGSSTTSTTTG